MFPGSIVDIMNALRLLLMQHLAADWPLTVSAMAGDTVLSLSDTSRYREGDEVLVKCLTMGMVERAKIKTVHKWDPTLGYQVTLESPLQGDWVVDQSHAPSVLKAVDYQPLKRIHLGDLKIIPDFPSITISPQDESNEWFTLGSTTHEYRLKIRIYTMADNFEAGVVRVSKWAEYVKETLLDHIHPVADWPPIIVPLESDALSPSTVLHVSDTSQFVPGERIYVRDGETRPGGSYEGTVQAVLDYTHIRLPLPIPIDFLVARNAEVVAVKRYLYDTRASSTSYGYVPGQGGSFANAAEISWFAKEQICRPGNTIDPT